MTIAQVDLRVGGDDHREVGALERLVQGQRAQPVRADVGHVRVVVDEVGAAFGQQPDDLQRGRLAHVADARLVGDAEDRNPRALDRLAGVVERAFDLLHAVVGHLHVDLPGELDELGGEVELAGAPREVERVHGQAVAAHARSGLEAHEAEGLGRGGVDHLPDVDLHAVGEDRQFVDQRDVDRAEDVLEQLGQLRRLGRAHGHDLVADQAVEVDRALRAHLGQAAHDLRRGADGEVLAAGVDALGREGQREVAARGQARLLEHGQQPLARGARVRRGLEHDELPRPQHPREGLGGVDQRAEVGLAVDGQRRRDAQQHRVGVRQRPHPRGRFEQVADPLQLSARNVLDVGLSGLQHGHLAGVDVHGDDALTRVREGDREREADVAHADDAHSHDRASLGGDEAFKGSHHPLPGPAVAVELGVLEGMRTLERRPRGVRVEVHEDVPTQIDSLHPFGRAP